MQLEVSDTCVVCALLLFDDVKHDHAGVKSIGKFHTKILSISRVFISQLSWPSLDYSKTHDSETDYLFICASKKIILAESLAIS